MEKEYARGIDIDNKIYVYEFVKSWYNGIVKNSVEITTWEGYGTIVNTHIIPYFVNRQMLLKDLTTDDLQRYFNGKYENGRVDGKGGLSANCLKKHYAVFKRALDYAVKCKLISVNPILNVELPKVNKYIANYYSVEQLEKLLEISQNTIIESAVFLAVHYGLRRGEILGMRYSDIDFSEKTVAVRNTRTGVYTNVEKQPKSVASIRTLPLSTNSLSSIFKRLLERNNMPHIRFHDIRHSVASLKEIQLWFGHSDISVTAMFYTHVDFAMKKNTGDKINEIFGGEEEITTRFARCMLRPANQSSLLLDFLGTTRSHSSSHLFLNENKKTP